MTAEPRTAHRKSGTLELASVARIFGVSEAQAWVYCSGRRIYERQKRAACQIGCLVRMASALSPLLSSAPPPTWRIHSFLYHFTSPPSSLQPKGFRPAGLEMVAWQPATSGVNRLQTALLPPDSGRHRGAGLETGTAHLSGPLHANRSRAESVFFTRATSAHQSLAASRTYPNQSAGNWRRRRR
ncbi:unnamed protein product, partial [Protopolystoma xenopodis]